MQNDIVDIVRPCWISKIEPFNGKWILSENEKPRGSFDVIVIAHNGMLQNSSVTLQVDFLIDSILLPAAG